MEWTLDWTTIGGNIAAALTVIIVVGRLVRRDRKDQKLIREVNGLAAALSRCMYHLEGRTSEEGSKENEHRTSH